MVLHAIEHGDAARYLAMMRTNALSQRFQFTDQETGFARLAHAADHLLGSESVPWYVS